MSRGVKSAKDIARYLLFSLVIGLTLCSVRNAAASDDQALSFRKACGDLVEGTSEDVMTVKGVENWLFLRNELRHLAAGKFWGDSAAQVSRASKEDRKDPLPAILDFRDQLDKLGIELILLPVPPKAVIYPDKLPVDMFSKAPAGQRLDVFHQEFYKLLGEKGVKAVDLFPVLSEKTGGQTYCKSDTHWSGYGCVKVAQVVAEEIKKMSWYSAVQKVKFEAEEKDLEIQGDLGRDLPQGDPAKQEKLKLRFISLNGKVPVADPHSPVLVMADSHGLVFSAGSDMHATGAGFVEQLAYELGFVTSVIAVRGSGATPTRISLYRDGKDDPEFLNTKKVIVWLFTAREFTETVGWANVPVRK